MDLGTLYSLIDSINTRQITENTILSLTVLLITLILVKLTKRFFKKVKKLNPDDNSFEDIIPFLSNLTRLGFLAILLFILLKIWGIDVTPLIGAAGVVGIAIAFAAQDSVSNLFGGVSIFLDKPFRVGDQILVEGSQRGHVYSIGARSTKIRTLDNVLVTIPNSVMVTNPIYNETGYDPKMRVTINIGVSYSSDLQKVENTLLTILKEHERILEYPDPLVRFTDFADSSIAVMASGVVERPELMYETRHELIKKIHKVFAEKGIEIPFPQRVVHMQN